MVPERNREPFLFQLSHYIKSESRLAETDISGAAIRE
jgi:hypothetical protein